MRQRTIHYRLRDRTLQRRLDELSSGDFTKSLEAEIESRQADTFRDDDGNIQPLGWNAREDCLFVSFGPDIKHAVPGKRFMVVFEPDDIEAVLTEGPGGWSRFPDVLPPEGVVFEVEYYADAGEEPQCIQRTHAIFKQGRWHTPDGREEFFGNAVLRFRSCDNQSDN